jgi:phage tail-like protein
MLNAIKNKLIIPHIAFASGHGSGQTFANTARYDPYKSYKFLVEISGNRLFAKAGFQKCTGLKATVDVTEYREGGDELTVSKTPGLTKFDPITLTRGMSEDVDMWNWAYESIYGTDQSPKYRAHVTIKLQDRDGTIVKTWNVPNAWISEYSTGDFDASGDAVMLENIILQHEGFTLA